MTRFSAPASFLPRMKFQLYFVAMILGIVSGKYFSTPADRECACENDEPGKVYFPHQVRNDFGGNWVTPTYNSASKVFVDQVTGITTHLVLCGTDVPAVGEKDQVVTVPIKRASIDSTTMYFLFELLNQRETIVLAHQGAEWALAPCLRDQLSAKSTNTTGAGESLGQVLNDTEVDVAFVSKANYEAAKKEYEELGTPFIVIDETDSDPLAITEWLEVVSIFLNREQAAEELTNAIESRFNCSKSSVDETIETPKTAFMKIDEYKPPTWERLSFGPQCENFTDMTFSFKPCDENEKHFMCTVVEEVNGEFATIDGNLNSSAMLDFVSTLDVLLFESQWNATENSEYNLRPCFEKLETLLNNTNVYKNRAIYDTFKTVNEYMYTDYFEGRLAQPDVFLLDVGSALHPNATKHTRKFMRNVFDESPVMMGTCEAIEDALYTDFLETPCGVNAEEVNGLGTSTEGACNELELGGGDEPDNENDDDNTGAIVGGVVGGVIGLIIVVAAVLSFKRKPSKPVLNKQPSGEQEEQEEASTQGITLA